MDLDFLKNKYEEFNNKLKSDNLLNLNNLNNELVNFLKNNKNEEIKTIKVFRKIRQLLTKLYDKKLDLKSKLKNNKLHISTDNDYYYDDNKSDNNIGGTNYVIYGSDLDPLDEPFQDLLDFCN